MKAVKCPSDELSLTNKAIVNTGDFPDDIRWVFFTYKPIKRPVFNRFLWPSSIASYIEVSTGPGQHFVFAIHRTPEVPKGSVGFSLLQRKWATLSINQDIDVKPYRFNPSSATECLCNVTMEVDFLQKKSYERRNDSNDELSAFIQLISIYFAGPLKSRTIPIWWPKNS